MPDMCMSLCIVFLVVTLMLSLSVYELVINDHLPTTSDAVPVVGKYLIIKETFNGH